MTDYCWVRLSLSSEPKRWRWFTCGDRDTCGFTWTRHGARRAATRARSTP
jgi:hypothetical protein